MKLTLISLLSLAVAAAWIYGGMRIAEDIARISLAKTEAVFDNN